MITNVKKKTSRRLKLKTENRKQISSRSWSAIEYEFQFWFPRQGMRHMKIYLFNCFAYISRFILAIMKSSLNCSAIISVCLFEFFAFAYLHT